MRENSFIADGDPAPTCRERTRLQPWGDFWKGQAFMGACPVWGLLNCRYLLDWCYGPSEACVSLSKIPPR
ncbi:hypothetical protein GCM10009850_034880 [Nonomuraea monospora]|uniref:Uncharacterized protein n=1 Tax=Nonomuraea monospora TaxID=568818 RepID=A0ABN3CFB0_9ACTN